MSERKFPPNPERFERITRAVLDTSSATDVALIQELVVEHLQKGPKVAGRLDLAAHVAEHFMHVCPAVMHDPRAAGVLERLETANSATRPAGGDPPNSEPPFGPGGPPPSPGFVVGGVIAGGVATAAACYYICETISAYCGDVHPAPGESAEVNC